MLQAIKWNSYFSLESSGRMVPDSRRDRRNPAFCFLPWFNILFSCSSVLPHGPLSDTKVGALFFDSWLFTFNTWGLFPLLGASVRVKFKDVQTGVGFQQAVEGGFFLWLRMLLRCWLNSTCYTWSTDRIMGSDQRVAPQTMVLALNRISSLPELFLIFVGLNILI